MKSDITINDAILEYIQHNIAKNLRSGTLDNQQRALKEFVNLTTVRHVYNITPKIVTHYIAKLHKTNKPSTVASKRGIVLAFVHWLQLNKLLAPDINYQQLVPHTKTNKKEIHILSREQLKRIISTIKNRKGVIKLCVKRDIALIMLLADTGARLNEALRLRIEDLHIESRSVHISSESKTRTMRTSFFGESTAKVLRDLMRVRAEYKIKSPYLFAGVRTDKVSDSCVEHMLKSIGNRCGIPNLTPHILRHTCATLLIRNGVPITLVQKQLGHSRISTTVDTYMHLVSDDLKNAVEGKCAFDE